MGDGVASGACSLEMAPEITHDLLVALTTSPWKGESALFPFPCWAWPQGFMGSVKAEREPSPGCHCKGAGPALLVQDI